MAAFQPARRWRKLILVLPIYLISFLIAGALLYILQIGLHGQFTANWLRIGALSSAIAAIWTAVRMPLHTRIVKPVTWALGIAGVLGVLTWLGMVGIASIVFTNEPTPAAPGAAEVSTTPLLLGVGLMAIFAVIGLVSAVRGVRAVSSAAVVQDAPMMPAAPFNYRSEVGSVVFSCIAITFVSLVAAQFVPVAHANPPVGPVVMQWDSPQTLKMAQRACMDCHSNETKWPWYSYVAPGSWLTVGHVEGDVMRSNFQALNEMPARRAANTYKHFEEQMKGGLMPPADYLIMHPEARLTDEEREQLLKGLQETHYALCPSRTSNSP